MAGKIKSAMKLLKIYAKMDLRFLLQDFRGAVIVIVSETLSNISGMAGILLLAVRFGGVGGLSADEILFMLGFTSFQTALAGCFSAITMLCTSAAASGADRWITC